MTSTPANQTNLITGLRAIWISAIRDLWSDRKRLFALTLGLWIPWNLVTNAVVEATAGGFAVAVPLALLLDALYAPFFGACVLTLLATGTGTSWGATLRHGARLVPRFWLIDLKINAIGLAIPFLTLHLGSAILLTAWPTYAAARGIIFATVVSLLWLLAVMIAYVLAPALLVADFRANGWEGRMTSPGWSMWGARRLLRGNLGVALGVVISGQLVVGASELLSPPGAGFVASIVDGLLMLVSLVWWALLWELLQHCLNNNEAASTA